MSDRVVDVVVSLDGADVEAGALYSHRRGRTESATFVYAREYVTRRGAYQLDPSLPLGTAPSQKAVAGLSDALRSWG